MPKGSPAVQQDMIYAPRKGDRIVSVNYTDLTTPANWLEADPPGLMLFVIIDEERYENACMRIYMNMHA